MAEFKSALVKFYYGDSESFKMIDKKRTNLYYLCDTGEMYAGDKRFGFGDLSVHTIGKGDIVTRLEWNSQQRVLNAVKETGYRLLPASPTEDGEYELRCDVIDGEPTVYWISKVDYFNLSSASEFTLSMDNTDGWVTSHDLEYSVDTITWTTWTGSEITGTKFYLRGTGNTEISGELVDNEPVRHPFIITGEDVRLSGNIETLLDYKTVIEGERPTMGECCFHSLFRDCTAITRLPNNLPATQLSEWCYSYMFRNTSISSIPDDFLPATTLVDHCYHGMFYACSNLHQIPSGLLPAKVLASSCYRNMFQRSAVVSIPEELLPATTLADYCYQGMFDRCSDLESLPSNLLPATTLSNSCYLGMFQSCTSLISIPEGFLPATTLADQCYNSLFYGCTTLTSVPSNLLPATELADSCYVAIFYGCTSLVTVPSDLLPATTLARNCYQNIFNGCTSLVILVDLPATDLPDGCYRNMFANCTSIKLSETQVDDYQIPYRIPVEGEGVTGTNSLLSMFANTGGTFTGTPEINTTYYTSNQVI